MIKFILFVVLVFAIIGSGDVFGFSSQDDIWTLTINHQELLTSVVDGFTIVYDFISELINSTQETTSSPAQ
jgi:low affinity Fe/Cu permease